MFLSVSLIYLKFLKYYTFCVEYLLDSDLVKSLSEEAKLKYLSENRLSKLIYIISVCLIISMALFAISQNILDIKNNRLYYFSNSESGFLLFLKKIPK